MHHCVVEYEDHNGHGLGTWPHLYPNSQADSAVLCVVRDPDDMYCQRARIPGRPLSVNQVRMVHISLLTEGDIEKCENTDDDIDTLMHA